jgi:hypothetical protein
VALTPADIRFHLSTKIGTGGMQRTSTGDGSLGLWISTTEYADNVLHAVFDFVSGDENQVSDVEYRLVFVRNAHATGTLFGARAWIGSEIAGGASAAISVDTTAALPAASTTAQAKSVATENTAPATQTFTAPSTKAAGLLLGDLLAGYCRGIWVRRSALNSTALELDGLDLRVGGDQAA